MLDLAKLLESNVLGTVISVYPPDTILPKPFIFVLDVARLKDSDAIEVAPNRILRRAANAEIEFAKKLIESLFGRHFSSGMWEKRRPQSGSGKYVTLPAKQWRYFVIEFNGDKEELDCLERALTIAPCDLQMGFVLLKTAVNGLAAPTCIYRPPQLFQSLSSLEREHYSERGSGSVFRKADGAQISNVYMRLRAYDHKILDLRRIFTLLIDLMDLPRFSPLQVLGYFAILESILTHQPIPDDPHDSITKQITRKLALLNNRWQPSLDYSGFGAVKHDKLWSKMYGYRSAIAHGGKPDFGSDLSMLRNAENANALIKETVKQTIRHCLIEPQLVADLHNC